MGGVETRKREISGVFASSKDMDPVRLGVHPYDSFKLNALKALSSKTVALESELQPMNLGKCNSVHNSYQTPAALDNYVSAKQMICFE